MLNHNHQCHLSDQKGSRSTISRNGKPNYNPRRRLNNIAQTLQPPGPRNTQPHFIRVKTLPIPHLKLHNTQFRNQTHQMTQNNGQTHHTRIFRATGASHDHQSFHSMKSFWLNSSFNNNFPGKYQNNYSHNSNISLNGQGTSHLEQVRYVVNDVNLLMAVITTKLLSKQ